MPPFSLCKTIVAFLSCLLFAQVGSGQNLFTNPGFETAPASGGSPAPGQLGGFAPGVPYYATNFPVTGTGANRVATPVTVDGWTFGVTGKGMAQTGGRTRFAEMEWFKPTGTINASGAPWDPTTTHGGLYAIMLNSDSTTNHVFAQQSVSLTAGVTYTLSVWVSGENQVTSPEPTLIITVNPGGASPITTTTAAAVPGVWTLETFSFVSNVTGTVPIRFEDNPSSSQPLFDMAIDDVSLVAVTPEPGTLVGLAVFGLGIGVVERRRAWHGLRTLWHAALLRLGPGV